MMSPKIIDSGKPTSPLRIVVPALVLVLLFIVIAIKGVLPLVEDRLLADKKEMLRELAGTAIQTLPTTMARSSGGGFRGRRPRNRRPVYWKTCATGLKIKIISGSTISDRK